MPRPLSPSHQKVWRFIQKEVRETGEFPSRRAIADHMGWKNKESANEVISKLMWRNKIQLIDGVRSIVERETHVISE